MGVQRSVWAWILPAAAIIILGDGSAQDRAVPINTHGALLHPQLTSEEYRSEEPRQSPSQYTGWSPELAPRDRGGSGRREVAAPDGGVLGNTQSMFAEIERDILVCGVCEVSLVWGIKCLTAA